MNLKPNPKFIKNVPAKDRKRWSDALLKCTRPQAHGQMVDDKGGWCCLMVGHEKWGGTDQQRQKYKPYFDSPFATAMHSENPSITSGDLSAGGCNDALGLTFAQIAALVYPEATEEAA